jgi:hypothetical protein
MDSKLGGKLLAFLLFSAAVVGGAVWVRGEFRRVGSQLHDLKSNLRTPAVAPPAVPASLPSP